MSEFDMIYLGLVIGGMTAFSVALAIVNALTAR